MKQTSFYTNVSCLGNDILYRGVKDGRRVKSKIEFNPSLYTPTTSESEYKTLYGGNLTKRKFGSIKEARGYVKSYGDVTEVFGQQTWEYSFIAEQHAKPVNFDIDDILIGIIDIEVFSESGFPTPEEAKFPITAITLTYLNDKTYVFGCGDYTKQGDEIYFKCYDEIDLCRKFLKIWSSKYPDILSGWYSKSFDIPYIVNRFTQLLGTEETNRLSPWGKIIEREVFDNNRKISTYKIVGVSHLDYIDLYKNIPYPRQRESYRLNEIAVLELGEGKISFEEYESLSRLYLENFQLYIEYNIKDVNLIVRLEEKMKLLELAATLAYDTKSNFEDVFSQTRMWDSMSYSYLLNKKIIVPPKVPHEKDRMFEGAYVKPVQVGLHEWIASFDLDGLHPHLMMQFNMSPETIVDANDYTPEMRKVIAEGVSVDKMLLKQVDTTFLDGMNLSLAPSGQFFRTGKQGFMPEMLEALYEGRKKFKKMMLSAEQELENETDDSKKYEIVKRIAKYKNIQMAKKLAMNSCFGIMGSPYFRFYDLRIAETITVSSQLSIRWIANKLNGYMNTLLKTDDIDFIIASDTDSVYLRFGELVDKVYVGKPKEVNGIIKFMDTICEKKIQPLINKSYIELADYVHAYAQKMNMKREALSNRGIWTAKKRYILNVYNNEGVQYTEPHIKVMGLEMVKSSTPSVIRKKMKDTIKIILNGNQHDIWRFILDFQREFKNLPVEDISFPRSITGLTKYADPVKLYVKGTPMTVKGALIYNQELKKQNLELKYAKIQEGEKIKYVHLKVPNTVQSPVITFATRLPSEFKLQKYIDYDKQFEKAYVNPISVILDCMGWTAFQVCTLDSFFG